MLAAAPGHRLAKRRGPASPDVLDGETVFLLEDGHCFRDQALAFCGAKGANEGDLKATGLSTLVQMVGGGDGVTLLPRLAVPRRESPRPARGARVPIAGSGAHAGAGLAEGVGDEAPPCRRGRGDQEGLAEVDFVTGTDTVNTPNRFSFCVRGRNCVETGC